MQAPEAVDGPDQGLLDPPDTELCELVRAGNAWPLETLWRRHYATALGWAMRKDPAVAEDAVSEAFDVIFQALIGGAGPRESFRAYLFRTVQTRLGQHWESRKRGTAIDELDLEDASSPPADDALSDSEHRAAAAAAFQELPPRWQQIILAVDVEGRSVQEVASELDLTPNSASVLLKRARDGLRKGWVERMHPVRNLPDDCATSVGRFKDLRWGKRNTRRRAEAEAHLEGCADCRRRWLLFGEQAGAVGLSLAGLIALTRDWRRRTATGTLAMLSAASVVLATAGAIGGLALPGSVPTEPRAPGTGMSGVEQATVDRLGDSPSLPQESRRAGGAAPSGRTPAATTPPTPGDAVAPAPTAPNPTAPSPTPTPGGEEPALYFGDWTGWCESTQTFSANC